MSAAHLHKPSPSTANPWAMVPLVGACSLVVALCVLGGNVLERSSEAPSSTSFSKTSSELHDQASSSDAASPSASDTQKTTSGSAASSSDTSFMPPANEGELSLIGSYEARSQSDIKNRSTNIALSAQAIDGVTINPGDVFSFNDTVGNTADDMRYQIAPIIEGDTLVDGRGGGICQVSTALYIAAIDANVAIVERHAHSLATDYAPIGLDATLDYGVLDLKLKNTTGYPLKIRARAQGQTVVVSLYGHPHPTGVTYEATSQVVSHYEQGSLGVSARGEPLPATYYTVDAFQIAYLNGVKTGSVLLSEDTYKVDQDSAVTLGEGSVAAGK